MHDVIVIGAGPGGLTASIYLARARAKVLLLEKCTAGGQLLLTETIENYPGFPDGVKAFDLIERMENQAKKFGAEIIIDETTQIIKDKDSFIVKTNSAVYESKSVILAVGSHAKRIGIKGESELLGKGVSYCATCDAALYKDKEVIVIGGGDTAVEESLYLTRFARYVRLVHRRNSLRAAKILQERLNNNKKIDFIGQTIALEVLGTNRVAGLKVENVATKEKQDLKCDGVFIFVGTEPNTGILKNLVLLDTDGYVITDDSMQTSSEGIFACGDCRKNNFKQVIVACGEAAVAASSCEKYISAKG